MEIQALSVVPGRVRFRLPEVKRSPQKAQHWEARLQAIDGVHRVAANPLTGSVLLHYHPQAVDWQALLTAFLGEGAPGRVNWEEFLAQAAAEALEEVADPNDILAHKVHGFVHKVNGVLEASTGGMNLRTLAPLTFFVFGLRDLLFSRHPARAPWFTLLWYAMSSFSKFNPPPQGDEKKGREEAEGLGLLEGAG